MRTRRRIAIGTACLAAALCPALEAAADPVLAGGYEPAVTSEPIFDLGGTAGWALRQIAIRHDGGPQTDLAYQHVTFGVSAQLFGLQRWVGVRARAGVDVLSSLEIDGVGVPPSFQQVSLRTELAPVFTWVFGTVGLHASAGLGFAHWFRGSDDAETVVVAAQEQLFVPVTLGATIVAGDVLITPELGAGFSVWYDSEQASIRDAVSAGTAEVQGLDLWLTLTVAAPL